MQYTLDMLTIDFKVSAYSIQIQNVLGRIICIGKDRIKKFLNV